MIRLALIGVEAAKGREIAARLRGADIIPAEDVAGIAMAVESCDAAAFLSGHPANAACVSKCLAAGKPVLLDARACQSREQWQCWFDAAQLSSTPWAIQNLDSHRPSRRLIREQLDAGLLGEPGLVRVHRWESTTHDPLESAHSFPSEVLLDLDTTCWLLNRWPDVVYAVGQATQTQLIHLGFAGGGMALLDYSNRLPFDEGYQSLSLIGSAGAAYADDHQNRQLLFRGGRAETLLTDESIKSLTAMLQDFVDARQTGRDLSASVLRWRRVLMVAELIQRSLAERQAIHTVWEGD